MKEFSYKEEYDKKTGSLHVVNSDGCDWCDGVGVNPNGCFCGECYMICKEECSARMTSRYIDEETRDILLSAVHMTDLEDTIQRILDEVPTADYAPVVHAHWIHRFCDHRNDYLDVLEYPYRCSACRVKNKELTKRCPECGAIMNKEVKYD